MPTIPRRWPTEVESERVEALQAAMDAAMYLRKAQKTLDSTRSNIHSNVNLAMIMLADTDRFIADAMTCMERIKRFMLVARSSPIEGRWPMGITKQRDDIEKAIEAAIDLLNKVQHNLGLVRDKVTINPGLGEAIVADISGFQARAGTLAERAVRLLTEVGIGRE